MVDSHDALLYLAYDGNERAGDLLSSVVALTTAAAFLDASAKPPAVISNASTITGAIAEKVFLRNMDSYRRPRKE